MDDPNEGAQSSGQPFTVLNVNDDEAGRYTTSRYLRMQGYQVMEASSGYEGLRLAQQEPDLVVLDVRLPDISGFEVCQKLKSDPRTKFIPVLHYTGTYRDSNSYARGLDSGADAYLIEPVEPEVLLATVKTLLRTAHAEAALRQTRDELEVRVAERTAALAAEVRERRQAEEKARRQAAHAEALARAAAHLGQELELNAVLEAIYTYTAQALDVPVVTISLYNAVKEQFEPASTMGLPTEIARSLQPIPYQLTIQPEDSIRAPIITPDVQELVDLPNAELYRELDIRTTVNVNLLRKGELVGRLNIGTIAEPRDFSESEMTLLRGFADLAALALNNARLFEEVKRGREQLADLNRRLTQAEEEERRRLAQELHDSAGQLATALQMNLTLIKNSLAEGGLRQQLAEAEALSGQLYEEIRQVSHSLRPPHLQVLGLNGALEALCQQFSETVRVRVHYEGKSLREVEEMVRISLYRVAQEALTNVARHAGGSEAWVRLESHNGQIWLTVEDNGRGFDVASALERSTGIGLQSMRERMQLMNGTLELSERPGGGTRLVARCPLDPPAP